ncbi:MAG: alpha/beta hydrolase [Planctomycetota bacterium]|jgi:pimeloyl-ACP methyl ester carboxylesterase
MSVGLLDIVAASSWFGRHWAALAIALTCLSLVFFLVLLMAKYVRIALNLFCDTPPPISVGPVDFRPIYGEVVRFRSFDGTSLRGMHISGSGRAGYKGTVIFCHEHGSDMYSCGRYARLLVEAGFDVFTFDFRGHGESSCDKRYHPLQWPSDKDMEDILGACAHVESVLEAAGKPVELGIFGISRGAGAALLAASSNENIKAVVCDGAFSAENTLIAFMKRWAQHFARVKLVYENHTETFWKVLAWVVLRFAQARMGCRYPSVRKALKDMQPRPIFFIHGQRDSYISVEQTRLLYAAAPSPRYLWIVAGAKHNQSAVVKPREHASRTAAFFRRYLAGEQISEEQITCPKSAEVA